MKISLTIERLLFACGIGMSAATAVYIVVAAPQFNAVFESSNYVPPLATRLFVRFYLLALILPLIVIATWRYWPSRRFRSLMSLVAGLIASVSLLAIFVWAMYLPIQEWGVAQ